VTEEGGEAAPVTGSVNSYSPEFGISRGDASLLARISEDTGGRVISDRAAAGNDSDTDLFERRALKHRPREIWEALMLSALLLLPFDVGVRRLHLTREQLGEARAWLASKLGRPSAEDADAETAVSHAQLKDARTRLKLGDEGPVSLDLGAQVPPPSRAEPLDGEGKESTAKPALPESIAESGEEPGGSEEPQTLASRLLELKRRRPR
jgi:hypothetical protein